MFTTRRCMPIMGRARPSPALLGAITVGLTLLGIGQARAQATSGAHVEENGPAEGDQLQEVVVTAEKRESGLQKTPLAVTAVSQEELVQNGVAETRACKKSLPT